jgi:LAO/AO transport system kinase
VSDAAGLAAGVRAGDRVALARAITLVESALPEHRARAQELLASLAPGPAAGAARRIGVSGPPGVGKSTLLDGFGSFLTARGLRVAVLAVDPSSARTGGSILGDKARMPRLAQDPHAFVRPSPSGATLGGVARRTRESLLLCEAAGYDVIFVETVGVGQSETAVAEMTDTFLVLFQPGSGDELQGMKKGILEVADVVAVAKADGEQSVAARAAVRDLSAALRLLGAQEDGWVAPVLAISSREGAGVEELWSALEAHRAALADGGGLTARRSTQRLRWLRARIEEGLFEAFGAHPGVAARRAQLEPEVAAGRVPPVAAAEELLRLFGAEPR